MIELDNMLKIPGGMVRLEGLEDALTPESEGWGHGKATPYSLTTSLNCLRWIALGIE